MNTVAFFVWLVIALSRQVKPYNLCTRLQADKPLELMAFGPSPRRVYILTKNLYVYELPRSAFHDTEQQLNLSNATGIPLESKWPQVFNSTVFKKNNATKTAFFYWTDTEDYLALRNTDDFVIVLNLQNYSVTIIEGLTINSFLVPLSGKGDPGVLIYMQNNPSCASSGFIVYSASIVPTSSSQHVEFLVLQEFAHSLCYESSRHEKVYANATMSTDCLADCTNPTNFLVSTGFSANGLLYIFTIEQTVYLIDERVFDYTNFDTSNTYTAYPYSTKTVRDFFQCPQAPITPTTQTVSRKDSRKESLVVAITVVSVICLVVWMILCSVSCHDNRINAPTSKVSHISHQKRKESLARRTSKQSIASLKEKRAQESESVGSIGKGKTIHKTIHKATH